MYFYLLWSQNERRCCKVGILVELRTVKALRCLNCILFVGMPVLFRAKGNVKVLRLEGILAAGLQRKFVAVALSVFFPRALGHLWKQIIHYSKIVLIFPKFLRSNWSNMDLRSSRLIKYSWPHINLLIIASLNQTQLNGFRAVILDKRVNFETIQ